MKSGWTASHLERYRMANKTYQVQVRRTISSPPRSDFVPRDSVLELDPADGDFWFVRHDYERTEHGYVDGNPPRYGVPRQRLASLESRDLLLRLPSSAMVSVMLVIWRRMTARRLRSSTRAAFAVRCWLASWAVSSSISARRFSGCLKNSPSSAMTPSSRDLAGMGGKSQVRVRVRFEQA